MFNRSQNELKLLIEFLKAISCKGRFRLRQTL